LTQLQFEAVKSLRYEPQVGLYIPMRLRDTGATAWLQTPTQQPVSSHIYIHMYCL